MPPNQPGLTSDEAFRMFQIVQLMRSTGEREFPAQLMAVLLWIGAHNGCKQEDLVKNCRMSASSVSRSVTWLGPRHRLEHRSGLRFVIRQRDPANHRAWRLYLTPKGQLFVDAIEAAFKSPSHALLHTVVQSKREMLAYDSDQDLGPSPGVHLEKQMEEVAISEDEPD